jgi:hypothetical protein
MQKRRSRRLSALLVASVANLKPARSLALDDDFAVRRAQFNLANVTTSGIDLLRNQHRALETTARSALRNVFAAVDANFCGRGVEIGLEHVRALRPSGCAVGGWSSSALLYPLTVKRKSTVRGRYAQRVVAQNQGVVT